MEIRDYRIGWICALPTEIAAAVCMLDERHEPLPQPTTDDNSYTFGRIESHNVVIAGLPAGKTGLTSAASVVEQMRTTFTNLQFGLMVGIAGGAPSVDHDIRLGDVVVSRPEGSYGGVVQYDFGKTIQQGRFVHSGFLNKPPDILLNAVNNLQARSMSEGPFMSSLINQSLTKFPYRRQAHTYPGVDADKLYHWSYDHLDGSPNCVECDRAKLIQRPSRASSEPQIHYGLIASGNQVMRDGNSRERLRQELNILCFEMEAAGMMDRFPCLVVRGICDYADSHKHKLWQDYAATTAAAYTKRLLSVIPQQRDFSGPLTNGLFQNTMRIQNRQPPNAYFDFGLNLSDAPDLPPSLFVGRTSDLETIQGVLRPESGTIDRTVLIIGGMGGLGKTQLAIRYAKLYRNCYSSIFWLDATSAVSLKRSYANLASSVRDYSPDLLRDDELMQSEALKWLSMRGNDKWLLIFDNYDNPEDYDISECYPRVSQGSVLITTRSPGSVNGEYLALDKLSSMGESLKILEVRSGRRNLERDEGAYQLVKRLDGFPLALATAGAFLKRSTITCSDYLKQYEAKWRIGQPRSTGLPEYRGRTLYATWDLSFSKIEREYPIAANLLRFLAYFDHKRIWFDLLHSGRATDSPTWFQQVSTDRFTFEEAMATLVEFSLVSAQHETGYYSLHICIHDWALDGLNAQIDTTRYWLALKCIADSITAPWASKRLVFVPHAERLTHPRFAHVTNPDIGSLEHTLILHAVGCLLYDHEQFAASEILFEKLFSVDQTAIDMYNERLLTANHFYGSALLLQGKVTEAERVLETTVRMYEKSRIPDRTIFSTLQSLIYVYASSQNREGTTKCGMWAIEMISNGLELNHYELLSGGMKIVVILQDTGQKSLASRLFDLILCYTDFNELEDDLTEVYFLDALGTYLLRQSNADGTKTIGIEASALFEKLSIPFEEPIQDNGYTLIETRITLSDLTREVVKHAIVCAEREMDEGISPFATGLSMIYASLLEMRCYVTKGTDEDVRPFLQRLIHLPKLIVGKGYSFGYFLAKLTGALLTVGNLQDAEIARCYSVLLGSGKSEFHWRHCSICFKNNKGKDQITHVCTQCFDRWLCGECMTKYLANNAVLEGCLNHQYLSIDISRHHLFNDDEENAWFESLQQKYV